MAQRKRNWFQDLLVRGMNSPVPMGAMTEVPDLAQGAMDKIAGNAFLDYWRNNIQGVDPGAYVNEQTRKSWETHPAYDPNIAVKDYTADVMRQLELNPYDRSQVGTPGDTGGAPGEGSSGGVSFRHGGMTPGSPSQVTPAQVHGQEFVMNHNASREFQPFLEWLNAIRPAPGMQAQDIMTPRPMPPRPGPDPNLPAWPQMPRLASIEG